MGTQPTAPKGAEPTQFSAYVYYGQTAAWIKVPLGAELGLGLGLRDIVFDVDPATPRKKVHTHLHPIFGPCLLWPRSPIAATAELLLCAVRGLLKGPAFGTAPGPALALMRPWGRRLGRGRRGRHLRKGGTSTINKKLSPVFRSTGT